MTTRISEPKARTVRTAIQASPALAIVEGIDAWYYDMNDRQYGVSVILLTMLFSFLQTTYEDYKGRALLRESNVSSPVVS